MPCRDLTLCLGLGMAAAGCAAGTRSPEATQAAAPAVSAPVIDAQGKQIGTAALLQSQFGASLVLKLRGLPPGAHGLHVHEKGACEPPGFASAGPHYNPEGRKHGTRNPEGPHAGDLPNLEVASDGTADATVPVSAALLAGLREGARALVIHARPDDLTTDPSGNSGDRIACAVLQPKK